MDKSQKFLRIEPQQPDAFLIESCAEIAVVLNFQNNSFLFEVDYVSNIQRLQAIHSTNPDVLIVEFARGKYSEMLWLLKALVQHARSIDPLCCLNQKDEQPEGGEDQVCMLYAMELPSTISLRAKALRIRLMEQDSPTNSLQQPKKPIPIRPLTDRPIIYYNETTRSEMVELACQQPSLRDALVTIAVWENDRAIRQAQKNYSDGQWTPNNAGWESCFGICFEEVMKKWDETHNSE